MGTVNIFTFEGKEYILEWVRDYEDFSECCSKLCVFDKIDSSEPCIKCKKLNDLKYREFSYFKNK
ncbi:MAG: hypothetical protein RSE41_01130 [Clostridia bacterium]